jgi:ubiquitin-protein ligase E3 A
MNRQKHTNFSEGVLDYMQVPFILTVDAKGKVLQVEADIEKRRMVQTSIVAQIFGNSDESPYLILAVRRSNLVQDSLHQLAEQQFYLKKPLKVVFVGEAGVDEGGVTKEFFQLLTRELFNVSYGMFIYSEEYRTFWFNHNSMESEQEFHLMGSILGLGIYNGVILDIHFPLVKSLSSLETLHTIVLGVK